MASQDQTYQTEMPPYRPSHFLSPKRHACYVIFLSKFTCRSLALKRDRLFSRTQNAIFYVVKSTSLKPKPVGSSALNDVAARRVTELLLLLLVLLLLLLSSVCFNLAKTDSSRPAAFWYSAPGLKFRYSDIPVSFGIATNAAHKLEQSTSHVAF
jgi:hypothetical protein